MRRSIQKDGPGGVSEFVGNQNVIGRLCDLERKRKIHRPRHARQIALPQWIGRQPVLKVLIPFGLRPLLIRYGAPLDDAEARRYRAERAQFSAAGGGGMGQQIPIGGVQRLPDAVQIWLPIRRTPLSSSRLRLLRRDVARIETVLTQRAAKAEKK